MHPERAPELTRQLSYQARSALHDAVFGYTIASMKWYESFRAGHDVGTPAAVDALLRQTPPSEHPALTLSPTIVMFPPDGKRLQERITSDEMTAWRNLAISGYLLGIDFSDEVTAAQIAPQCFNGNHHSVYPSLHNAAEFYDAEGKNMTNVIGAAMPVLVRYPDQHGRNQLEGELRRWQSSQLQTYRNPRVLEMTRTCIEDYCDAHQLGGRVAYRFAQRLGI
ncbi:hypothetical protein COY28_01445 [Candidatus Woesearchaeota archaeon CG_4_10_14_0_2_um_filter_57_5]|nr:MAG: hypothetical protein AUJ68_06210 [Candidatus Woesearchaeota archaeon CG1_02_57_44]PIZ55841.1 MAG: hypothetical protein COY28_01445 [Candidatus Woesearchaeota archaeon CG_4_10_14_0_2_um_filter_57_5]